MSLHSPTAVVPDSRGIGEFSVVEALPEVIVVAFAAVTHLADPWFLFGLLAVVYWFGDDRIAPHPRRAGATAIAVVAAGYAAVALGKAATTAARPPAAAGPIDIPAWLPGVLGAWYEGQLVSDGFGFPSGHATGAVVAYGVLALVVTELGTPRRRYTAAVGIALAVVLSRVVIEVHYLVDVVAGVVVGATVLGAGLWLAGDPRIRGRSKRTGRSWLDPTPVFALAAAVSTAALAATVAGGHTDEVVEAGIGVATGIGGVIGWRLVDGNEAAVPVRIALPTLVLTGGLWVGAYTLAGSLPVALAATTAAVATVVAVPALSERIERRFDARS